MDQNDSLAFIELLVMYKRLWIANRVADALRRNPDSDRETVWMWVEGVATEGLEPVFQALESGQDVLSALREALKAVGPPDERLG